MSQAQNPVSISVDELQGTFTIHNHSDHAIMAWRIGGSGAKISYTKVLDGEEPIAPRKSRSYSMNRQYLLNSSAQLDGVLFDGGHVSGPNTWRVDKHYKAWQETQDGGPVHYSKKHFSLIGNSLTFVNQFANKFQKRRGFRPVVVEETKVSDEPPPPCDPDCDPDFDTIEPWTLLATGYFNGVMNYVGAGAGAECDEAWRLPGPYSWTTECDVAAECTESHEVMISGSAYTSCLYATITANGFLQENGSFDNLYTNGQVDYTNGIRISTESTADCVSVNIGPPEVEMCGGVGN
jgi:hypothetical protein